MCVCVYIYTYIGIYWLYYIALDISASAEGRCASLLRYTSIYTYPSIYLYLYVCVYIYICIYIGIYRLYLYSPRHFGEQNRALRLFAQVHIYIR